MGLKEDIKQQKGFKSERQKAVVNIVYTEGWIRDLMAETLKPFDLTTQQYNVLRILRGSYPKPLSTSDIRSRMLDKMSDASRIVDRLVKKELLERRVCVEDKRRVDVVIAKKGLKMLDEIDGSMKDFDNHLKSISEDEAATLNAILDKLRS
ncbi:MarR family winged helix-turn-helix transcriptional regulator [Bacteroidota bacterium]